MVKRLPEVPEITLFDFENGQVRQDLLEAINAAEEEIRRIEEERTRKQRKRKTDRIEAIAHPFNCTKCDLHITKGANYVLPEGDLKTAKILFVGEAPGCFPKGTPILTRKGYRRIETIRKGHVVLGRKAQPQKVVNTYRRLHRGLLVEILAEKFKVTLTDEHPLLVYDISPSAKENIVWKPALEVSPGDYLLVPNGAPTQYKFRNPKRFFYEGWPFKGIRVDAVKSYPRDLVVYNIQTEDHSFLVPFVVHNSQEAAEGRPFIGKAGQLFRSTLEKTGIPLKDVCITNAVLCRPPNNRTPSTDELNACFPYLNWVIQQMPNLKVIVPMGNASLASLTGLKKITEKRGLIYQKDNRTFIPTLHPAAILRDNSKMSLFEDDFKKIKEYVYTNINVGKYRLVDNKDLLQKVFDRLDSVDLFAFDIETFGRTKIDFETKQPKSGTESIFYLHPILGLSFSWAEKTGVYIPLYVDKKLYWDDETIEYIKSRLSSLVKNKKKFVLHGGKFDVKFIKHFFGIDLFEPMYLDENGYPHFPFFFDTMIAHYLLWERPPHDLKNLSRQFVDLAYYEAELDSYKRDNKIEGYQDIPTEILYKYAAADADATLRLYNIFSKQLKEQGREELFFRLAMPLLAVLSDMEYRGVKVDVTLLNNLALQLKKERDDAEKVIKQIAGQDFNVRSAPQLRKVLTKLGLLKNPSYTKSGQVSVDKSVLSNISHPFVDALLKYRKAHKLYTTYILNLLYRKDSSNRAHANFNVTGTETGRLSSSDPNLQNIPSGDILRPVFIAEEGYSFIIADYSQIELRVMAFYSQDPVLLQVFKEGGDVHTQVAKRIFKKQKVSDKERKIAKTINFGLIYGRGPASIADQVGITVEEARKFVSDYFKQFKKVAEFRESLKQQTYHDTYLTTVFGRVRHLPEIRSNDPEVRAHAERQALNMPIQSTAADCTNQASILLHFLFKEFGLDAHLVLSVHDELVVEVKNEQLEQAVPLVHTIMKETAEKVLKLPVEIDIFVNKCWTEFSDAEEQKKYLESIGVNPELLSRY